MEIPSMTLNDIERYLKATGKRGASVLSNLGKLNPYFNAVMGSTIGQELLKDDVDNMEKLLEKIYSENATPQEMAEFRYLRDKRFPVLLKRITYYLEQIGEIKKAGAK
jgi:hypothetical protein